MPLGILVRLLSQVGHHASDRTRPPNYPCSGSTLHVTGWLPTMHSAHETLKPGFVKPDLGMPNLPIHGATWVGDDSPCYHCE